MIMGGGSSESLSVLTEVRSEPSVPFGGKFRLIDFPLSNCVNSAIFKVAVLTQYKPRSLNDHIGIGKPWDLDRATGGVRLLQPYRGGPYGDWQKGTADAVRRNLDFVEAQQEENVLILAGDHIYIMDYTPMMLQHANQNADITVAVRRVSPHETHRYGIVAVDSNSSIVEFQEKPKRSRDTLASMGIYIFRKQVLMDLLMENNYVDFGREVLPAMLAQRYGVYAYTYPGYWADVGTIQAYWEANMSLISETPPLDLYDPNWVVHTRSQERAPAKVGPNAEQVGGNLISNGARIYGAIERSVISPGVVVGNNAVVRDSIILNDTIIEDGAVIDRAIIDKRAVIGAGSVIGDGEDNTANQDYADVLNTGISLVGKGSFVPAQMSIGRNVVIHAFTTEKQYGRRKKVASGLSVGRNLR
ncbi:MAG: glucose-1-phosphate adenylyltransferase [Caldilineaceae bacterium]|nr:glucose-1-phosphate adenylyltransferase [Caldilineaceae bacterium]